MKRFPASPCALWLALILPLAALLTAYTGSGAAPAVPAAPVQLRLEVQNQGLVWVTYEDLEAAGFTQGPIAVNALDLLGTEFFTLLFAGGDLNIGAICTQAKVLAYQQGAMADLLRTFTLIGDPAMRLSLQP
jgi:hypothetical protein